MIIVNFHCTQCGYVHDAKDWFVKKSDDGIPAYVCGKSVDGVLDRSKWKPLKVSARPFLAP